MWISTVSYSIESKGLWATLERWPDFKKQSLFLLLHTFGLYLILACLHAHSPRWCNAFSHPFTHDSSPPTFPSLPWLPVDAPNMATLVVSGCLRERSLCQPAGPCLPGDRPHACSLLCLVFFPTPSAFHSPDLSSLPSISVSNLLSLLFLLLLVIPSHSSSPFLSSRLSLSFHMFPTGFFSCLSPFHFLISLFTPHFSTSALIRPHQQQQHVTHRNVSLSAIRNKKELEILIVQKTECSGTNLGFLL